MASLLNCSTLCKLDTSSLACVSAFPLQRTVQNGLSGRFTSKKFCRNVTFCPLRKGFQSKVPKRAFYTVIRSSGSSNSNGSLDETSDQDKVMLIRRPQFVLFGSSTVQLSFGGGWGSVLAHLYSRKADVVMRGYSGWNSIRGIEVLDQVFPKDAPVKPSLVIVYFGGNDSTFPHPSGLGPHVPIPEYVKNMRKIITHLKGLSETTRLIFITTLPVNETRVREELGDTFEERGRSNETSEKYSAELAQLCQELNVKALDLWPVFKERDDWETAYFIEDGIHLSAEGNKVVAREILRMLHHADWEPSLFWRNMPSEFPEDSDLYPVTADGKGTTNPTEFPYIPHYEDF